MLTPPRGHKKLLAASPLGDFGFGPDTHHAKPANEPRVHVNYAGISCLMLGASSHSTRQPG